MTKNRSMRIAILVLALALLTSCFVGSTFAKYTSSSEGTGTATVAKWAFTVNDKDVAASEAFTFDFLSTYYDDATGTNEETGVNGKKLAPGTKGAFSFEVVNGSDVKAHYSIDIQVADTSVDQLPTNIKFSTDGETYNKSLAEVVATLNGDLAYSDGAEGGADEANPTVYWMWAFETTDGDDEDTTDGIGAGVITFEATITATQVDQ